MRIKVLILLIAVLSPLFVPAKLHNHSAVNDKDTLIKQDIQFTPYAASRYIGELLQRDSLWKDHGDTISLSLSRLLYHYSEPFDSVEKRLHHFEYEAVRPELQEFVRRDTVPVRWLNEYTFIIDTLALTKDPFITKKTIITSRIDTLSFRGLDSIPDLRMFIDSISYAQDTIIEVFIDSLYLKSRNITTYLVVDEEVQPPLIAPGSVREYQFSPDSSLVIFSEKYYKYVAEESSPFYVVPGLMMPDSLRFAVGELLNYMHHRDSIPLYINDPKGNRMAFWLSAKPGDMLRYWVHNHENDSITIWIGNPAKNEILLILEDDIHVERMGKLDVTDVPIIDMEPDKSLIALKPLEEIPSAWVYGLSTAFSLNQNYISNWARGGESALSSLLDLRGSADYHNRSSKIKWTNNARLRYGNILSEEFGFRTNQDIFEMNSQYNRNIRDKFDFSAVFYGKTQISRGYDFPNDSVPISTFLSPGTFTIGAGFEYEPIRNTKFNLSLLSYRNTFVLDTTLINQRAHGIELGKRAKHEMGGQLVINSRTSLFEDVAVNNIVRLFSNYLDKPQNIDVDWEINLSKRFSYYFTISLNLHLIYDENILFPVFDKQGEPVLLPDGSSKVEPRIQIKQFLGVTMSISL